MPSHSHRSLPCPVLICAVVIGLLSIAARTAQTQGQPSVRKVPAPQLKNLVEKLGGGASLVLARQLGLTEIAGKRIGGGSPGNAQAKKLKDVAIGADPVQEEDEPSVAANPKSKKYLVAGSQSFPSANFETGCVAYSSSDSGATWSAPYPMPQLESYSFCSDPVIVYAPNGSRVYYTYMDIKSVDDLTNWPASYTANVDWDVVVSYSDDNGATWVGPVVALDGDPYEMTFTPCPQPWEYCGTVSEPGFVFDKPWIGTHVDPGQSAWVYVTATEFPVTAEPAESAISFTGSSNKGASWSAPFTVASGGQDWRVQGSRPVGGLGGEVLVAWYDQGDDGWLGGGFEIRTRRSYNHGAVGSWDDIVVAATDSYELQYFLGPYFFPDPFGGFYKRWWCAMFPDVEVDLQGRAHIVYTHDPDPSFDTAEDGDIRYIASPGPPYGAGSWSTPMTVNDDGMVRAQGYAALKVQHGSDGEALVHVIWEDSRLSPDVPIEFPNSPNLYYDIFYARKPGTYPFFSRNMRVSEASSIQGFFTGDYNDLAANDRLLFAIWTDRRDKSDIMDFENDVYGSRIIPGGAAP